MLNLFMAKDNPMAELLKWYLDSGVDCFLDNTPCNRLIDRPVRQNSPPTIRAAKGNTEIKKKDASRELISREASFETAQKTANASTSLDELKAAISNFEGCPLKFTAKNLVFGSGAVNPGLMIIGEAPGAEEDRQGLPFVGRAGQLLDKMLNSIDLTRDLVYITNILPWRPPGNRPPTDTEISACLPFIRRQILLVKPKILIMLGGTSAKTLLGTTDGIMRLRGRWTEYASEELSSPIIARALLHPAFLLRQPEQKRETWLDLLEIKAKLQSLR